MGLRTLGISASGLNAQLVSQAVSSANTANAVTPALSPSRVTLASLDGGGVTANLSQTSSSIRGSLILTGNPLDLAIGGVGFFLIGGKDRLKLTRDGRFAIDAEGFLATLDGERISPEIRFPKDTQSAHIDRYGDVVAQRGEGREFLGTIELATVASPNSLRKNGGTALEVTPVSGPVVRGFPGQAGFGLLVQGGIESSGTDLTIETLDTITAARAFSANARVFVLAATINRDTMTLGDRPRRNKQGGTDIDLRRSQVADLVSRLSSSTSKLAGRKLSPEVRAHLRARRITPEEIATESLSARKHLTVRFDRGHNAEELVDAESSSFLSQEIRLARRRGFELYAMRLGRKS